MNVGGFSSAKEAPDPDLGRRGVDQVPATDDEVDALTQVVDHDAERVGPIAVAIADRRVAGRGDVPRARPNGRIHPCLTTRADRGP